MTLKQGSINPREKYDKPPFPNQQQEMPGIESEMEPRPNYGVESYKGSGKLKDKVALITGGDSGIGRAVALAMSREGAQVAISYLNEEEDATELKQIIEKEGNKCLCLEGDIQEEMHCVDIVEKTRKEFGKIDILINNAAYQMGRKGIEDFSADEIEMTFRINIFSMFHLTKAAIKYMQPGSCIINTTSIQAFDPSPELMPYAATKAAIANFTRALSKQLIEKGIRVNAVAPGPVWTPLIVSSFDNKKVSSFGEDSVFKRPAQPIELAPVYVFLASEDASYITGEIYGVTGGRLQL